MGPACAAVAVPPWPARDAAHLLVRSDQLAALEMELFASGLPVEALMEKAALQISRRLLAEPALLADGVLVLVGPGHNGGDGLVVARELHLAGVDVTLWSPFERRKPLTDAHWRHALWLGLEWSRTSPDPTEARLWIDALFGTGQQRAPGEAIEILLAARHAQRPGRLVAIDVPTGLCAETGQLLGTAAACACLTFCLGLLKQGLVQDSALAWVGELERFDLGLPAALLNTLPANQPLGLTAADLASAPWPTPPPAAAKYGRGRLLVVAGSDAYRGAALLSLLGASASGCGSLRAALPPPVAAGLWAVLPQVVVQRALASTGSGGLSLAALGEAGALDRLDAVLLGPGIGIGPERGDSKDAPAWQSQPQPHRPNRNQASLMANNICIHTWTGRQTDR
jgi:NAD(P)H-hydrate epimerase